MKSGKCPMCGGENVFLLEGKTHRAALESSWGKMRSTRDDACADCGQVESCLRSEEDKARVRETWARV